ncbi:MAG TPA: GtrA family protein [Thermodesulfovibrionales bacterium]|nr:GtrA family protein [Thermodesulfovibrionales bacterium]
MKYLSEKWSWSKILAVPHQEKIIGFFLIGAFSTLIDVGLLYFFTEYIGIWYLYSATVSYICGMIINFLLNKYLNFRDTSRNYLRQFSFFALISMSSLALTLGLLYIAVEIYSINYLLGKALAVFIAFLWNYFGQSKITFHLGKREISGDLREYLK